MSTPVPNPTPELTPAPVATPESAPAPESTQTLISEPTPEPAPVSDLTPAKKSKLKPGIIALIVTIVFLLGLGGTFFGLVAGGVINLGTVGNSISSVFSGGPTVPDVEKIKSVCADYNGTFKQQDDQQMDLDSVSTFVKFLILSDSMEMTDIENSPNYYKATLENKPSSDDQPSMTWYRKAYVVAYDNVVITSMINDDASSEAVLTALGANK